MSKDATDRPPPDAQRRNADEAAPPPGSADDRPTPPSPGSADDRPTPPSPFPHPPWTVNLVLVAGVITLLFGVLVSPLWLLVGSPFVVALVLWTYVRLFAKG